MNNRLTILLFLTISLVACNDKSTEEVSAKTVPMKEVSEKVVATNENEEDGGKLHAEKCAACHLVEHNAAFYQRKDRKMKSYAGLQKQVIFCDSQLGLELFEEEAVAIGDYLNDNYYKFEK